MLLKNSNHGFTSNTTTMLKMDGEGYSGGYTYTNLSYNYSSSHYGGSGYSAFNVVIGAGDTIPTIDDYDLADSSIMASDKMVSLNQAATYTNAGGATVTVQWKNNSNSAITVKEVGLAYKIAPQVYNKGANILIARKVLDNPVTIQPGETYAFSYNLKI